MDNRSLIIKSKKRIFIGVSVLLALVAGCAGNDSGNVEARKEKTTIGKKESGLQLDMFKIIPDTIEGCAMYYAYDTVLKEEGHYIFLAKTNEFALIKVQGHDIYLSYDEANSKQLSENSFKYVFTGKGYTAVLITRVVKAIEAEETSINAGTLEVFTDKKRVLLKIRGRSGC